MRRLLIVAALVSIIAINTYAAPRSAPVLVDTATPTRSGIFLPLVRNPPTDTPTNTATATLAPTNTPIATNTPLPAGVIVLPTHSWYIRGGSNYLHIVGEVLNNTGSTIQFVKISANVFNGAVLVATDFTYTSMNTLPAGQKTCFDILVQKPAAWTSYQFEPVSYSPATSRLPNLTLLNISTSIDSIGAYHIIGQVRNDESVKVTYVEPIGALYSGSGTVLDCGFTFVNSTDLNPGQTSAFDMVFFSRDSYTGVASYRVQVDGNLP